MGVVMKKVTVLSIDDDKDFQFVLGSYLGDNGYRLISAYSGAEARAQLAVAPVDVILLDLILPDGEGMDMIAMIRTHTKAPIIIVSGKDDTMEKIVGLEMGADDYITKPFELRELVARIKAVLRRTAETPGPTGSTANDAPEKVYFNDWCIDRMQLQLFTKDGRSAGLTTGEFRLLESLALSPNRALSRDYLFELTHDSEFQSYDRAVDIQIGRIRKKMKALVKDCEAIKTVRGVGYMFCAPVIRKAS